MNAIRKGYVGALVLMDGFLIWYQKMRLDDAESRMGAAEREVDGNIPLVSGAGRLRSVSMNYAEAEEQRRIISKSLEHIRGRREVNYGLLRKS